MAEKNARLQLENSDWKSESGGYNNVSVAEEVKEDESNEYVRSLGQG